MNEQRATCGVLPIPRSMAEQVYIDGLAAVRRSDRIYALRKGRPHPIHWSAEDILQLL
jgi:hypothetical protein